LIKGGVKEFESPLEDGGSSNCRRCLIFSKVFLAVAAQEKHLGERFELSVHRPHPKDCD
jgi:hypothetical protein